MAGPAKCKNVFKASPLAACVQMSPIFFASHGKECLHNAVPNHVPVSHCSGFEFRINYGVVVFVARPLNCNFHQSFKTIFPSDRSKITSLTGEMGTVVTG